MIKLVRMDERLIHGQIAIKWSRHLSVDRIIVANDAAASNEVVKESLMMAAPATCKTAIVTMDKFIEMMKNPKAAEHDLLIIVSNPKDLIKTLDSVQGIPQINIGNYGRIASKRGTEQRKTYASNLYAYPEEVEDFKKVLSYGIKTVYQTIPDDIPQELSKVLGL